MTSTLRPAPAGSALAPSLLSPQERTTLAWVCGSLFPQLEAGPGDDAAFFAADAVSLGVPAAMEEALSALGEAQVNEFRRLLRLLDQPLFALSLTGKPKPFRALHATDRERLLLAMATNQLPPLRRGFQALRRLAAFLFYSLMDEQRRNPTWSGIGYTPSANPPSRDAALALTHIAGPTTLDCDVCIVGSGAGGGVAAAVLAVAGLHVVVLEQGAADQAPDFDQREIVGMQRLYLHRGTTTTRDLGVAILAGACVGGGTTVNWQTSLRLPDEVRAEWSERSGCDLFTSERFARALDAVCERSGVSTAESGVNANNAMLRRGCEVLSWRQQIIPRNARGCDPAQCGYCTFGCRHGGKQSTAVTFLADAQQRGHTTIVPNCRALRVTRAGGAASGVRAVAHDVTSSMGTEYPVEVRARRVVVAAGAIETPALLLRSGIAHPALGRNLYLHPTSAAAGRYASPVRTWEGPPQTVLCDHYAALQGNYGVRLEAAPAHPGLHALALPWFGARDHRERMQRLSQVSATIVVARDEEGGRVRVRRDGRAVLRYRPGRRELEHLRRGLVAAVRAHLAAGAEEVLTLHSRRHVLSLAQGSAASGAVDAFCERVLADAIDANWSTLFSAHQMGTCRMGADRKAAPCDETGAVRGVRGLHVADASLFPASSGVNPMITVMALARVVAAGIADAP
ncbi:MAG TPA: GMC family oxidoreductase [Gemmatimonadaceae bacterium]|nr:GMC family oxidoreductase [Gemmatimonadaceae bacterium]